MCDEQTPKDVCEEANLQIDNGILAGQSCHMLKSWYRSGDPEQGFLGCFADGLDQSLVSSVALQVSS